MGRKNTTFDPIQLKDENNIHALAFDDFIDSVPEIDCILERGSASLQLDIGKQLLKDFDG